ncbi:MAG: sigma-70 family RNA polymerase sigma factor [Candidatus Latescibacterota bacterium]|jgi:RNA polymerase sigma factor (sigma-70 family)
MAEADQILVVQTLNGRLDAFGLLVERYSGLVWALILERVRRGDQIEDLVQETFCTAYQALPDLRDPARFAPWLCRIARNTALHWTRQEQCRLRAEDGAPSSTSLPDPEEAFAVAEQDQAVWQALDALPEPVRQLVVLRHLERCTYRDLARFLGISVTAVRWRLLRAEQQVARGLVQLLRDGSQTRGPDRQRLRRRVLAGLAAALPLAPRSEALTLSWWNLGHLLPALKTAVPALVGVGTAGTLVAHLAGLSLPGWPAGSDPTDRVAAVTVAQDSLIRVQLAPLPALPGPTACEPPPPPPDSRRLTALSFVEVAAASGAESTATGLMPPAAVILPAVSGEKERVTAPEPDAALQSRRSVQRAQIHGIILTGTQDGPRIRGGQTRGVPQGIRALFAYLRDHTQINSGLVWDESPLARSSGPTPRLLYLEDASSPLLFDEGEKLKLAELLRAGALLYAEDTTRSDPARSRGRAGAASDDTPFFERFKALLADRWVLGEQGESWRAAPYNHPLFTAHYTFRRGPPADGAPQDALKDLELLELRGHLVAIFNRRGTGWYRTDELDLPVPHLQFGVNLLIFAHAQSDGR